MNPPGATASTATGINNAGDIAGFLTLASGNTEGFYSNGSTTTEFETPGSTNTMFFGLNNGNEVVGSSADANGVEHGIVYNTTNGSWYTVDDPNASSTAAFGVSGTFLNGVNDNDQLVGFYSDGTNVNGFLATAAPEPASFGLAEIALAAWGLGWKLKQRKS